MRRSLGVLLAILAVGAGGCARSAAEPGPTGLFDVGDGRKLFLDCQGQGQLPTPLVFVAHSYGGLILDVLARTHPELVAGIVMVDGVSEFLMTLGSPAQNAAFERDSATPPEPGDEAVLMDDAFARIRSAPPLPRVPAIVLSSDKFAPPAALKPDNYTQAQIHQANSMLAAALGTVNIVSTGAGHNMMLYQPKFVADNIIEIVERVREG